MEKEEKIPDTPGLSREDLPINQDGELTIPTNKEEFKKEYSRDQAEMLWKVFAAVLLTQSQIESTVRSFLWNLEPEKMKEFEEEEKLDRIEKLLEGILREGR